MHTSYQPWSGRCLRLAAALFMATIVPVAAQEQEQPEATPDERAPVFTDTVEVNVVNIYATVVDKKQNPVTGLTADDFIVEENGNPMEITNFTAVGEVEMGISEESSPEAGQQSRTAPEPKYPLQVAVVFDNTALENRQRKRVLKAMAPWVPEVTKDGGKVLVAVLEPELQILVPFTSDSSAVLSALEEVSRRPTQGEMAKNNKR